MAQENILKSVLETYFCQGVEFSYDELNQFLNDGKFPKRAMEFKNELAQAILNNTITPTEFKALTTLDQDSQAEVNEFLTTEVWNQLYGNAPVEIIG